MGKKAKVNHTPRPRAAEQLTPDDDGHWTPIEAAHQRRAERTGNGHIAAADLNKLQAQGRIRSIARSERTGEWKQVTPSEWTDQIELLFWKGRTRVYSRRSSRIAVAGHREKFGRLPVRGWQYYVSQLDLDCVWPPVSGAGSTPTAHDDASKALRVRPGPKPHGDWPTLIEQWLHTLDPQQRQNVDALVPEAKKYLRNQIKWAPKDNKDLRAKIVEQLKLVRR